MTHSDTSNHRIDILSRAFQGGQRGSEKEPEAGVKVELG